MARMIDTTTQLRCPICETEVDIGIRSDGKYANGEVRLFVDMSDARDHIAACVAESKAEVRDPYDPADADERAENDAERIAEMSEDERERYGDL